MTPVVRLLRATKDFVFLDSDTIQAGRRWRAEIAGALRNASLVVVFWCRHSSESSEVEVEYQAAIAAEKDILPVLLDSTPIAPALTEFQWIDFRELARERHLDLEVSETGPARMDDLRPSAQPMVRRMFKAAAFLAIAAFTLMILSLFSLSAASPDAGNSPIALLIVIGSFIVALGIWAIRWKRKRKPVSTDASANPTIQEQQMSASLQEEIQRRHRMQLV